jgi:hypothetical protein
MLGKAWNITRGHILDTYKSNDEVDRWYRELNPQHQRAVSREEGDKGTE